MCPPASPVRLDPPTRAPLETGGTLDETLFRIPERDVLLERVDALGDQVRNEADQAESKRHLTDGVFEALRENGILSMVRPHELGGLEADPVTQHEVISRLATHDASAGWVAFINAGSSAFVGACIPQDGLEEVQATLPSGQLWTEFAGSPQPFGQAERVEGGYRFTGRWPWLSGIHHSDWIYIGALVKQPASTEAAPPAPIVGVVPKSEVVVEDTWHTSGLRGTGSTHCNATNLFIPDHRIMGFPETQRQRGGVLFDLPVLNFFGPAFSGLPFGVGRRALDEIMSIAEHKRRVTSPNTLAERPVFQRDLARADRGLRAIELLTRQELTSLWHRIQKGVRTEGLELARLRAAYTEGADAAIVATEVAYRYGGGDALYESSVLQRLLRDMRAASQHLLLSESNYEALGAEMLAGRSKN